MPCEHSVECGDKCHSEKVIILSRESMSQCGGSVYINAVIAARSARFEFGANG